MLNFFVNYILWFLAHLFISVLGLLSYRFVWTLYIRDVIGYNFIGILSCTVDSILRFYYLSF